MIKRKIQTPGADMIHAQPHAPEVERGVLGAAITSPECLSVIADILQLEDFYLSDHRLVYEAILSLYQRSQPVDLVTLADQLRKRSTLDQIGGPSALVELTNYTTGSDLANIEYKSRLIQQYSVQRKIIQFGYELINRGADRGTDVPEYLAFAEARFYTLTDFKALRGAQNALVVSTLALQQIEAIQSAGDGLSGISTGFKNLNKLTRGWQSSDLVILAGRPGMGKTSLMIAHVLAPAQSGQGVAVFSLEMTNTQIMQRMISMQSGVPVSDLRGKQLTQNDWEVLHRATEELSQLPIYMDDTPAINILELRSRARRLKRQKDIKLIVIDYLQLMSGIPTGAGYKNRETEISEISRGLKAIAKELDVPVIALSQLSRAVETRGGTKRPQLSDLRESGAIEQDADIVSFIYRPEYYNVLEDEHGNSLKGLAEYIVAKHRNGSLNTVRLKFIDKQTLFTEWEAAVGDDYHNINTATQFPVKRNDADIPF